MYPTIRQIIEQIASESPAPGGGSVSAMAGANGAALVAMVCRLTVSKKKYEAVADEMRNILAKAEDLHERLARLVDTDSAAFDQVMAAVKMPKDTAGQQDERHQAMQAATRHATEVPLQTMRACSEALELAEAVAAKGNSNALSDAGVAALMLEAGMQGARFNVLINLGGLEDAAFAGACRKEADDLADRAFKTRTRILESIGSRLS